MNRIRVTTPIKTEMRKVGTEWARGVGGSLDEGPIQIEVAWIIFCGSGDAAVRFITGCQITKDCAMLIPDSRYVMTLFYIGMAEILLLTRGSSIGISDDL